MIKEIPNELSDFNNFHPKKSTLPFSKYIAKSTIIICFLNIIVICALIFIKNFIISNIISSILLFISIVFNLFSLSIILTFFPVIFNVISTFSVFENSITGFVIYFLIISLLCLIFSFIITFSRCCGFCNNINEFSIKV